MNRAQEYVPLQSMVRSPITASESLAHRMIQCKLYDGPGVDKQTGMILALSGVNPDLPYTCHRPISELKHAYIPLCQRPNVTYGFVLLEAVPEYTRDQSR